MFKFRRKEIPWEVVDNKSVDPIPMYYEDEDLDLDSVSATDILGTYLFDVKHPKHGNDLYNAVVFSRQQLLQEVVKKGYNVLMLESWSVTVFRRGIHHRVEVRYSGRPAHAVGKPPAVRNPPFMGILKTIH